MDEKTSPLQIDKDIKNSFKAYCAKHDLSMKTVIESMIIEKMKEETKTGDGNE